MTGAKAMALIAAATVAVLLPSCTRTVDDARAVAGERPTATAEAGGGECTPVDVPLVVVPTDAGEPVLKIPKPPGWERFTEMDSEMVRFTMRNESLAASAVVTFESGAGTGDPQEALDGVREGMMDVLGPDADVDITTRTHCGLTAERIQYINPGFGQSGPMPGTALAIAMVHDGMFYVAAVNVLTKAPDNPTYERDAEAIITGFQMLPPSPS